MTVDHQLLLDATERVVERDGLARVTADAIAEEAGISRVTLYRRGLNPATLLRDLAEQAAAAYRDALIPPLTAGGSGRDRLELALTAICDAAEPHLALLAGLYDGPTAIFHLLADGYSGARLTRLDYTAPLERILRDGCADGTLACDDPTQTAEVLFNQVGWSYVHMRRSHGWTRRRARASLVGFALSAVATSR